MLALTELGLPVTDGLRPALLESVLRVAGECPEPRLNEGLRPLLTRPAKRLRPALVFAAAACGPRLSTADALNCAGALELMHLSSLVHDDLMDRSPTRGGQPTLHATAGPDAAILGGDFLLTAGGRLAAEVSAAAAVAWHECYADLCVGQARETANRFRGDVTVEEYLQAINGKTAALMRTACYLGGLSGGLGEPEARALAGFGDAFGMVFQLVDDLMDTVSSEALWSKPVEQDVANGVYTVCVLGAAEHRPELRTVLAGELNAADVAHVYQLAREYGIPAALAHIEDQIARAEALLAALPDSPAVDRLAALPRRYLERVLAGKVDPRHARWLHAKLDDQVTTAV